MTSSKGMRIKVQQRLCLEEKEERLEMATPMNGNVQVSRPGLLRSLDPRPDWRTRGFSTIMVTVALNLSNY
ncbi:uncharacterized protein EAE97_008255 [Botrytis byssoidea]|uniref:Uncharacterized protein n=1 Tax=Botrytis byssoidea TaxID=139641 RepID=A0A9P5IIS0_9HELO|nr:uncharacterized protein EAE97_008255 [Botrytis byssoidea]KAF7935348.1 hypothetical protein EAE97_008255 [Botrytis byssoidea]